MTPAFAALRRLDALLDRRRVALPLFAALAVAFTSPLYLRPMHLGHGDWVWFHFIWETARKSYVEFHEVPWWNPYACGGNLGVANPQGFGLSPLFLALLWLPTAPAMKVYLTTLTFGGLWGAWQLCRERYGKGLWAVAAACLYALSGYMGWHMNGQTGMANLQLLPWVVLCFLRGLARPAWAIGAGATLAFMLLTAGLYPCVISCVALALYGLVVVVVGDLAEVGRVARSGLVAASSAAGFAAIKLAPMVDYLRDHRRPIARDDAVSLGVLVDALFVRRTTETQIWGHEGHLYAWWGEYSNYVGVAGACVALSALWLARGRLRRERLAALAALSLVIGDHGSYSPYAVLRMLPMLGNLRVPTRYWVVVDLWVACAVAWSGARASRLVAIGPRTRGRALIAWAGVAVVAWLVVDLVRSDGVAIFRGAMPTPPAPVSTPGAPFRQVAGAPWQMHLRAPRNEGTLRCFDELTVEISPALRPDLPSEAYLLEPDAGSVVVERWRPSTWELAVDVARPTTVIVNQNGFRGWRAEGGELVEHEGLVAVRVAAGRRRVVVAYRPNGYLVGAAVTLACVGATLWLVVRRRGGAATA